MKTNNDITPLNKVRLKDREVTDEAWMKDFLYRSQYGVLGTSDSDQPFLHSRLFVYDEVTKAIYLHGALQGRTPSNIRANDRVCFTVSEMGRLLPADEACEFSVEYASVVVFGHAQILAEKDDMIYGLQLLIDKYFPDHHPGVHYPTLDSKQVSGTAVYKITIDSWSGKQKQAPPDFPGAFIYNQTHKPA
jgi:nitroimidazol reductase NimA-like FMN-containing flavoprotein (pyridoxamine 5'-phosphate oxidase superfamily)